MTAEDVMKRLESHQLWLSDKEGGVLAVFENVILENVDISHIDFRGCEFRHVTFNKVDCRNCNFSGVKFSRSSFVDSDLTGCSFYKAHFELLTIGTSVADRVNMSGATFQRVTLLDTSLKHSKFNKSDHIDSTYRTCSMSGSSLSEARLFNTNLYMCNLRNTDMTHIFPKISYLINCDVRGSKIHYTKLEMMVHANRVKMDGCEIGWESPTQDEQLSNLKLVAEHALKPQALNMKVWHSACGTAHCLAGWILVLNNSAKELSEKTSPKFAGQVYLGDEASSLFLAYDDRAIEFLTHL